MTGAVTLEGREYTFRTLSQEESRELLALTDHRARAVRILALAVFGTGGATREEIARAAGRLCVAVMELTLRARLGAMTAAMN